MKRVKDGEVYRHVRSEPAEYIEAVRSVYDEAKLAGLVVRLRLVGSKRVVLEISK